LSSPNTRVINDSCCAPITDTSPRLLLAIDQQLTTTRPQNFCRETSALALCALLCRFAS
jgi:hypothetical protein